MDADTALRVATSAAMLIGRDRKRQLRYAARPQSKTWRNSMT